VGVGAGAEQMTGKEGAGVQRALGGVSGWRCCNLLQAGGPMRRQGAGSLPSGISPALALVLVLFGATYRTSNVCL
jgi:hypothetical protein